MQVLHSHMKKEIDSCQSTLTAYDLVKTRGMRRISICLMAVWLDNSCCFYLSTCLLSTSPVVFQSIICVYLYLLSHLLICLFSSLSSHLPSRCSVLLLNRLSVPLSGVYSIMCVEVQHQQLSSSAGLPPVLRTTVW